ncbi:MFS transporter [Nocardioides acrostichi]|uniref:MHS family MFS transporter n=1 Tax=Nocardioides acrostichi TaxID=2784339 RepID=A0A930UXJ9_9ACTN|nr:MFS transporter [Nocardioides acrostichi]MBF4160229.1 MHS family MFS transporter [Nocardioides acrostichi]
MSRHRTTSASSGPPSPRRVAVAAAVGATIEWYDFFLYGTAAAVVFDKLYFNGLDGPAAQFAAFATFAVGFLARPVGGLVFGHFGDRVGRKTMLLLTLVIMGVGTALVGLLPTYDQIGVWAPIALVVLRVLQGIGVGGEYGGAVLLAVEYAPAERRGFLGSFAHIGVPGGLLLAAASFSLAGLLPDEAFLAWGWRACFLASVVLLGIGAYIRLSVTETPAFAKVQAEHEVSRLPLGDLLRHQSKPLLLGMGTRFIEGLTFNLFSVYLLAYVVTNLELPRSWALSGILVGAGLGVVLVPLTGALSDRIGRLPVYRAGTWLGLLVAFPAAALVSSGERWLIFAAFVLGLGLVYGVVYGPLAAFWSEQFETRYRYTALSTLYQVSGVVASGLTPLIAAWLVARGHGTLWWVAGYNVVVAAVSLTCARFLPETRGIDLDAVGRPAATAVETKVPVPA